MEKKRISVEAKVGIFALVGVILISYLSFRVSDRSVSRGGTYDLYVVLNSASGMTEKTPVEIAGVQIGYIGGIELLDNRNARIKMKLRKDVKLTRDVVAQVRTKGFLGETYIDLIPGDNASGYLKPGEEITAVNPFVDISEIATTFNEAGQDADKVLKNLEKFTARLTEFSEKNYGKWDEIVENMKIISDDLRVAMKQGREDLSDTMERISSITAKIDEGQGSIGRLVNNPETVDNLNNTLRGVEQTVGGVNRFQMGLGYHLEYLGESDDFKNYVELELKPRPDKFFLLEFIVDPNPPAERSTTTSTVTTGGTSTTVTTDRAVIQQDRFMVSAQLAKSFYDFTVRGGVIESEGGIGMDYNKGPVGLKFSAFDWRMDNNERPHLKAFATLNLTNNLYVLGGVDDFISQLQDPDWMFGAGFRLVDEDIKSLFGAIKLR